MLGPLRATDIHTPGPTFSFSSTLSLFRYVPRLSVLRFMQPHPSRVPATIRARCKRAQLRSREQARPVIPGTCRRVRRRDARPVDHPVANTWPLAVLRGDRAKCGYRVCCPLMILGRFRQRPQQRMIRRRVRPAARGDYRTHFDWLRHRAHKQARGPGEGEWCPRCHRAGHRRGRPLRDRSLLCSLRALLELEQGGDAGAIDRCHRCGVTDARLFGGLPVLDELAAGAVVAEAGPSGGDEFDVVGGY